MQTRPASSWSGKMPTDTAGGARPRRCQNKPTAKSWRGLRMGCGGPASKPYRGGNAKMARQRDPDGHRRTRQCRSFLEGKMGCHANERLLAQQSEFGQHPVEIGAEPVGHDDKRL